MFTKRIIVKTNLSFREVLVLLKKGISEDYFLSSGKVMSGHIHGTKINGAINLPGLLYDGFRTIVKGDIISENGKTELHFKLSFSIMSKITLIIWYVPIMLAVLSHRGNHNLYEFLKVFGAVTILSLICFTLLWLKLIWDKNRLEEWLLQNFKRKNH